MKAAIKCVLLLLLTFSCRHLYAKKEGQELIDSLIVALQKVPEDTNRLNILHYISENGEDGIWQMYNDQLGRCAEKLIPAASRAISLKAKKCYTLYLNNKGYETLLKGDYSNALLLFDSVLQMAKETRDTLDYLASLTSIGAIYDRQNEQKDALQTYLQALAIGEQSKTNELLPAILSNIAKMYHQQNDSVNELAYLQRGEKIITEKKISNFDCPTLFCALGDLMLHRGDATTAMAYFQKAREMADKVGTSHGKVLSIIRIARAYMAEGKHDPALALGKEALDIATKAKYLKLVSDAALLLNNLYLEQGDHKHAYEMYTIHIAARDSLSTADNQKAVMRHQFQSDFDLKQAKIKAEQDKQNALAAKEVQKQKLVRDYFMGGFVVVLLFAGVFFKQRNKISQEKKLSEKLLLNILPAEVADELKAKGNAEAKLIDEVTVLFTDFKGFTQLSEKLSPKALVAEINECFSAFDHIMERYGVEKIKTIGDAYMAAGGLPTANKTHPEDVVNAALEIQKFMMKHKEKKEAVGDLYFEIRIGVHTGPVVAGIVGVKKFQYDIWGDTVNTASRMESSSEVGKVNISESTYELVKDKFATEHRGKVSAKGKGHIDMYYVSRLN